LQTHKQETFEAGIIVSSSKQEGETYGRSGTYLCADPFPYVFVEIDNTYFYGFSS